MTSLRITPFGRPTVSRTLRPGWNRLDTDIGVQWERGADAVQFRCARGGWYAIRVVFPGAGPFDSDRVWEHEGYLPPRAILTVRPDSPPPNLGLLRVVGDPSDYSGGGGQGIDACGAPGTVHDHDATMQRHACGLYDMATGKLRDAKLVPVAGYYRMSRGIDPRLATNKVACLPDYSQPASADIYDDGRVPRDATAIPAAGAELRASVLRWQAFDDQHLIRAYRFALLHLDDPFIQADLRAICRDAEVAWDEARTNAILASPGGKGHPAIGRAFAWVLYAAATEEKLGNRLIAAARDLFGIGFASRLRKVARHVAHRDTGILQRFVEGMSGSPYPYGPFPASGVAVGKQIGLTQHLEACATIVALEAAGMKREALKLARTILLASNRQKWINTDTGKPEGGGWHGPADDQAWPAIGALLRMDRRSGLEAAMNHKVVAAGGAWVGPFLTLDLQLKALKASPERGKNAWAIAEIEKVRGAA